MPLNWNPDLRKSGAGRPLPIREFPCKSLYLVSPPRRSEKSSARAGGRNSHLAGGVSGMALTQNTGAPCEPLWPGAPAIRMVGGLEMCQAGGSFVAGNAPQTGTAYQKRRACQAVKSPASRKLAGLELPFTGIEPQIRKPTKPPGSASTRGKPYGMSPSWMRALMILSGSPLMAPLLCSPPFLILSTASMPSTTWPQTEYCLSSHGASSKQI